MPTPSLASLVEPTASPARVLVVDPDPEARRWADLCLRPQGHSVHATSDADLIETARQRGFDLVLMDPAARAGRGTRHGHDAWQRLRGLRDQCARLPVIVMHAGHDADDRTVALELGADAVVDKPCEPRELRARVTALLRRLREQAADRVICFGPWRLDPDQRRLHVPTGLQISLSAAECRLLQTLLRHPRRGLGPAQLRELVQDGDGTPIDRRVDQLISRLGPHLDADARHDQLLHRLRGVSHWFDALD